MAELVLSVNGSEHRVQIAPAETLLSVLRDRLKLTGTKYGCGEGACGACTVLIDGTATRSCRTLAINTAGKKLVTIEGLSHNGTLHPVQEAFLAEEAFQCGYCTPGMIISTLGLLTSAPNPTEEQISQRMNGNVCRCGTYPRIVAAVKRAAAAMRRT